MAGASRPTTATTAGVKYRPSTVPSTHSPALRSRGEPRVGAPAMLAAATASSGPIIQGSGQCSACAAQPASAAPASVATSSPAGRRGVAGLTAPASLGRGEVGLFVQRRVVGVADLVGAVDRLAV